MRSGSVGRPRALLGTALAVAASLLAGCAQVPTSGPVVAARPVLAQDPAPYVGIVPPDPRPGDDEVAMVEGFLAAMASYVPGYPVARRYLTPEAAASWQPAAAVTVVDGSSGPALQQTGAGQVRLSYALAGTVGSDGSFAKAAPGARFDLDLTLGQVGGEWRIDNPPPGIVVSDFDFGREFRPYDRYFFDPTFSVLVPDAVYLPVRGSVSTLLVESVLRGPSQWLAPAVVTAIPAGTDLAVRSVPVDGATAQVDLDQTAAPASGTDRSRLAAQITWTLGQVPDVRFVDLTIGGLPLDPTDPTPGPIPVESVAALDPGSGLSDKPLVAVADGRRVDLRESGLVPGPAPLGEEGAAIRSLGLLQRGSVTAAVTSDGAGLVVQRGAGDLVRVLDGVDLGVPAFDREGLVWVVERAAARPPRVVGLQNDVRDVQVPALDGWRLDALEPAPDGTRAAILATDPGGRLALLVALVLRTADGLRLEGVREVPTGLGPITSVAWADGSTLAVLPVGTGLVTTPSLVDLSGARVEPRGRVAGGVSIAAAPGQPLVVADADGRLLRQDGQLRWRDVGAAGSPAYGQ